MVASPPSTDVQKRVVVGFREERVPILSLEMAAKDV